MEKYDFEAIEKRWQKIWKDANYGRAVDFDKKPKHYHLVEFPYPSGQGLHVGHCMGYGASDAYCRMKRMQGHNVLYPIGWDAFGLPTENYAIKTGIQPAKATEDNIKVFKRQIKALGYSFDWSREINTTNPDYYKWTQWIFLQFYKHAIVDGKLVEVADDDATTPRLAYQKEMPINWCPSCKIGLANEEVIDGKCERCGTETSKRLQKQWLLRITAYADRLISDLGTIDYLDKIKTQQINWIGKSEGSIIKFEIRNSKFEKKAHKIEVFTTRADTLFGCTYLVLSPEHPLVEKLKDSITNYDEVCKYVINARTKSDLERTELQKDKTGVELKGINAINPINDEEVSVWVADYVLASYGTGAVMAVPAHDDRDFEFAKKYGIGIKAVIIPEQDEFNITKIKNTKKILSLYSKILAEAEKENVKVWILGGLACAFHAGFIYREHDDLDLIVKTDDDLDRLSEIFAKLKIKQISEKKIDEKLTNRIFKTNDDLEIDIGPCLGAFGLVDKDFVEAKMTLDEVNAYVLSKRFTRSFKELQVNKRGYLKDKLDFTYLNGALVDYGVLTNSGEFSGLTSEEAKKKITEKLNASGAGNFTVNFKLRDWIFSRQHYWGEPIPIVHCSRCGMRPLSGSDLPLTLPEVENYLPTDSGESPLAAITGWVNTTCPECGGPAKRETDTMPNWAGSSWYFLAYAAGQPASTAGKRVSESASQQDNNFNIFRNCKDAIEYWLPTDIYNGGMEHTTLHLLYSRFWHKFLYDLKAVPCPEPYAKRIAHGIILGPDGQKMSKSRGNIINPDEMIDRFGADTLRTYVMFIGPYDQESAWSTAGIQGVSRFLNRVWNNQDQCSEKAKDTVKLLIKLNQTNAGVTKDLESFHMNTVISKLMELNNLIEKENGVSKKSYSVFLRLLYPAAPHIASEIWQRQINNGDISDAVWPMPDEKYLTEDQVEIVIQVNGKVRDRLLVECGISDEALKKAILIRPKVIEHTNGHKINKVIIIPNKLVSLVIES